MTQGNAATAQAYYRAMNSKDTAAMARHLHPDESLCGFGCCPGRGGRLGSGYCAQAILYPLPKASAQVQSNLGF
jgi:hypothetical protein